MSKGKRYKMPHKYIHKYGRKFYHRYKGVRGKNGEKAKFKYFRHKELWKILDGRISIRKMVVRHIWFWD